jgi:hypothetical protein
MYSAAGLLNGFFSEGDLPDSIFMLPYDLSAVVDDYAGQEVQRQGTTYETPPFFPSTYTQSVEYIADFEGLGPQWLFKTSANSIAVIDYRQCLFNPEQEGEYAQDLFKDTYTVTHNTGSGQVTRTSLCVWEGTDNNGCPMILQYNGTPLDLPATSDSYKWIIAVGVFDPIFGCENVEGGAKQDPQNSPVGDYIFDFDGSVIATVSEE